MVSRGSAPSVLANDRHHRTTVAPYPATTFANAFEADPAGDNQELGWGPATGFADGFAMPEALLEDHGASHWFHLHVQGLLEPAWAGGVPASADFQAGHPTGYLNFPSPTSGLSIPDYSSLATQISPPGSALVQIGDSLPAIAKRELGDASRWAEIYELNRDQILNPDVILPGMVLFLPPGSKPTTPTPKPPYNPPPPAPEHPAIPSPDEQALRHVTPQQLAHLGATDKKRFFAVLKPAAIAAERRYGVPWQVTLAQVALESGWGRHAIGGYNVFGIKGNGPAGGVVKSTKEWRRGQYVSEEARFAKYHDFYEAVMEHGKLFHNGHYDKAVRQFSQDRDPVAFTRNIHGIYATSPSYARNLLTLMKQYQLID